MHAYPLQSESFYEYVQDVAGTFTHAVAMVMMECPALGVEVSWLHAKDIQQFVSIKINKINSAENAPPPFTGRKVAIQ